MWSALGKDREVGVRVVGSVSASVWKSQQHRLEDKTWRKLQGWQCVRNINSILNISKNMSLYNFTNLVMTRMRLKFENAMMCTQAPLVERFLNVGVKKQLSVIRNYVKNDIYSRCVFILRIKTHHQIYSNSWCCLCISN